MIWILIILLIIGIALVVKSNSRSYKILGYVLLVIFLLFILFFISNLGVDTEEEISENPVIQLDE